MQSCTFELIQTIVTATLAFIALASLIATVVVAKRKNSVPYGQLRILWLIEHLVAALKEERLDDVVPNLNLLKLHFFNWNDEKNEQGTNNEDGTWYFVWETEKAYDDMLRVLNNSKDNSGIIFDNVISKNADLRMAVKKARVLLKVQQDYVRKIREG